MAVQKTVKHKPCHTLLKETAGNVIVFQQKGYLTQMQAELINEAPLGQVKIVHLFKVAV